MFRDIARSLAGIAAMGLALAAGGCDASSTVTIDGHKGVPLDQLRIDDQKPATLTLLGPDRVRVLRGDKLAITVEGDPAVTARLRFALDDDQLGISREGWNVKMSDPVATINVTLPAARRLIMAGSGTIDADSLTGDEAGVTIAGSGTVQAPAIDARTLKVEVLGSGKLQAGGKADLLKLTVAGSGEAAMDGLGVRRADVDVAGSGVTRFASDGEVNAKIMGSGEVHVKGRAACKVSAMGSGKLVCTP